MTTRPEGQIKELLASTAAEYVEEERAAAEESREASTVFSVRLPAETYAALRANHGLPHGVASTTTTRVTGCIATGEQEPRPA